MQDAQGLPLAFYTYRRQLAIYGACGASELFFLGGCALLLIDYLVEPLAGAGLACPIGVECDAHFMGDASVPIPVGIDDQVGDCQQATVFIDFMGIGCRYRSVVDVTHDAFDIHGGSFILEGGKGLWRGVWVVDFHVVSIKHEMSVATHIILPFLSLLTCRQCDLHLSCIGVTVEL